MTTTNLHHIHGGTYPVGISPETAELCRSRFPREMKADWLLNCTPLHDVTVRDVYLSTRLVSVAQFSAFVEATGYVTEAENDGWGWIWHDGWLKEKGANWRRPFRGKGNDVYSANPEVSPVLQVSWNDADAYCRYRALSDSGCRLPFEAEWEVFAQQNGLSSMENVTVSREVGPFDDYAYMNEILGSLRANTPAGSLSLVWEWSQEWYDAYPCGPSHNEFGTTYKVMRGGSLRSHAMQRSFQFRFRRCPTARSSFYGFRCAFDR